MASSRNRTPPEADPVAAVAAVLAVAGVGSGTRLCVALSGGVDSVVLLQVLVRLRERFGLELSAAHVHHGLSAAADDWCAFCARLCASLQVPFRSFPVAVPRHDRRGLEAAARGLRHRALSSIDTDWIAFGHHQDDQAETVLFRLFRGAGVRGAGAMAEIEPPRGDAAGRLRPLLGVRREAIEGFARALGLEWVEDESNLDQAFARNRLRHSIVPALQEAFPGVVPALARASGHFREAQGLLDELASIDAQRCGSPLSRVRMLGLSDARIANLLRRQVSDLGAEAPPRARLVEVVRQFRQAGERPLRLGLGGVSCCVYRGQVWLESEAGADAVPEAVRWEGGGNVPWGSGIIRFERGWGEGLDASRVEGAREVVLTGRWEGLVLRQAVGRPRRSFKNLCQEAGIPAWMRSRLPVFRIDGQAAWIGSIGVAAEFACPKGAPGILPRWLPAG